MSFLDFYYKDKRTDVLKELENFGKTLAYKADQNNYKEEDKKKALHYVPELKECRKVYLRIKEGEDAIKLLTELNLFVKEKELELLISKIRRENDRLHKT